MCIYMNIITYIYIYIYTHSYTVHVFPSKYWIPQKLDQL